jgi:hypothetical protein
MEIQEQLIEDICKVMMKHNATARDGQVALLSVLMSSLKAAGYTKANTIEWISKGWDRVKLDLLDISKN